MTLEEDLQWTRLARFAVIAAALAVGGAAVSVSLTTRKFQAQKHLDDASVAESLRRIADRYAPAAAQTERP
jgi:hypothetical protein